MGILANENAIETGGYNIANSLRFQSASSQYLSRTLTTPTSNKIWTWSAWIKRGRLSVANINLLASYDGSSANSAYLAFNSNDTITFQYGGAASNAGTTTSVYRDTASWYHLVWSVNATTGASTLYINGTSVATASIANVASQINSAIVHNIGQLYSSLWFFDGYMAEVNFVDGQALTPSSFGETNTLTGQWVAKKYTGTYGTNGFYLPFSNGTSTTTLGYDSSGNSNNWTLTNFTRSAGVTDCWMNDVPSGNGSAGTQPNSNYAVLNPLTKTGVGSLTISNSNLRAAGSAAGYIAAVSTVGMTSGKYYFEAMLVSSPGTSDQWGFGLYDVTKLATSGTPWQYSTTYSLLGNGNKYTSNASAGATGVGTFGANDVMGVAFDADAGTLQINKNGGAFTTVFSSIPAGTYLFGVNTYASTDIMTANFGQRSFAYTPPSGFKALCTANLPASTIVKGNQYMDATLYTGNGASRTVTNAGGFNPDLVWVKSRSNGGTWHILADSVRGAGYQLSSNQTGAEVYDAQGVGFASNGFTLGADTVDAYYGWNINGDTYVGWQWDAGSSTVTNTSGSISSQVRANPTAGVSVVTYTGTGAAATVGHGLGVAPKMIINKIRNSGGTYDWYVYHASLGATSVIYLNLTLAAGSGSGVWGSTAPTSTVFSIQNSSGGTNVNAGTYVSYCFAEIAGFSKFGSYTGNGSADGTFVYTGFRPKYVMIKRYSAVEDWYIWDSSRNTANPETAALYPNQSLAESTGYTFGDFLSNGFKNTNTGTATNASGSTYIYMAFAENPFAQANAR